MTKKSNQKYRPCAAIMLVNTAGQAFVGKRIDTKEGDWWQMPQGGIDHGEDIEQAALRELYEEVGLTADMVAIIARTKDELYYDLPDELQGKLWGGKYIGQRQTWFLMRFNGTDEDINLTAHDPAEFADWKWVEPDELPKLIIPFKKPIYRAVLAEFGKLI